MTQETLANPFGMDEACRNCPELCDARARVVHGYGDVDADVVFVGDRPDPVADEAGVPFAGVGGTEPSAMFRMLERVGLGDATDDPRRPTLENAYLTHLTRCRHPDRPPTDDEVATCEPYLDAEIRSINPELIVPVGERALAAIAAEYTTESPSALDVRERHGTTVRGRGFELVPMIDPGRATDAEREEWVDAFRELLETDYRQTKGRRRR